MEPILLVQGGAGRYRKSLEKRRETIERELRKALERGMEALLRGNALDAVVEAVTYMEECGEFNAGKGAVVNAAGEVELDAGVMWGPTLDVGAVGGLKGYWNAVRLARIVMEETDHVLLTSEGAAKLAEKYGLEKHPGVHPRIEAAREYVWREFVEGRYRWSKNVELVKSLGYSTVGAVALDREGNLAAASSTGGIWFKLPGRLGDTPIPGAGFYADRSAASSATGQGEYIARYLLTARVSWKVGAGLSLREAVREVVEEMTKMFGDDTAGVIAVDNKGNYEYAANTQVFIRGLHKGGKVRTALLSSEGL